MQIIVGLRNPGAQYSATRHNVGARAVKVLAAHHQARWKRRPLRARCETAQIRVANHNVLLGLPIRMMNVSGESVGYLMRYHRVGVDRLLLIHDDIDLPFGKLRVRSGGGAGGHNGVKSVAKSLGESGFWRLKIGLGRPPSGMDPADYVLRRFRSAERDAIDRTIERAAELAELWVRDPLAGRQSAGEWNSSG